VYGLRRHVVGQFVSIFWSNWLPRKSYSWRQPGAHSCWLLVTKMEVTRTPLVQ